MTSKSYGGILIYALRFMFFYFNLSRHAKLVIALAPHANNNFEC